jgi:hypothetical protein
VLGEQAVVVLVEGESDVAALEVLLRRRGLASGVVLRDMGGVTNVRVRLREAVSDVSTRRVLGLCDARESAYVVRALVAHGVPVTTAEEMAAFGFHACDPDLEGELIAALGAEQARAVIGRLDLGPAFELFGRQQAWRGRPLAEQLRRFAGTVSGRKTLVARAMAEAVADEQLPAPMRRLLDQVQDAVGQVGGPALARFEG